MQDRFKFRAIVKGYYCLDTPEKYEEFEPIIFLEDVDVLSNGEIGIIEDKLEVAIREQHPNLDSVDIGYMLENFRNDGCGIDNYVTITPEVVYQCTGLKDKNGKLIYEGDILKVNTGSRDTSGYGVVEYMQCGCNFVISGFLDNPSGYHPRKKGEFCQKLQEWLVIEVIGNIYENPKLLENKE